MHRPLQSGSSHAKPICPVSLEVEKAAELAAFSTYALKLRRPDVLSLPALRSLGDIELHRLALLQATEAARLDC